MTAQETLSALFSRAEKDGDCLVVPCKSRRPYVSHNGQSWLAYRFVYSVLHGEIPQGMVILHRCDNPKCIKDEHLKLGTQYENISDAISKKRMGTWADPHKSGFARLESRVEQSVKDAVSEYCKKIGKSEGWFIRKAVIENPELTHFLAKEQVCHSST